jgi:signal transduction histidine kinase
MADVRLAECCAEVDVLVGAAAAAKRLTYTCHLNEAGGPLIVRGDRGHVFQILVNLVTNAVKYTGEGGTIAVEAAAEGDRVTVCVHDTGRGIPAEQWEAIFEPFVQVDRTRTGREGAGLGLAIGRELARGMGGDIAVASAVGAGSTFTLTLLRASAVG